MCPHITLQILVVHLHDLNPFKKSPVCVHTLVNVVFKEVLLIYFGVCTWWYLENVCCDTSRNLRQFVTFWTEHIYVFIYFTVLMVANGIMLYFS